MEFNQETVSKIAENTKAAREVWSEFSGNVKLKECFHLRPTKIGITVVSTLPYAPMRGVSVSTKDLREILIKITEKINVLLGVDTDKALRLLEKWSFKSRTSDSFLEENAQAMFIQGMIMKQVIYEDIEFVASELILADKSSRFDIVGFKDGDIYVFELKKGRTTLGFEQTAQYATLLEQNKSTFLEVLRNYPHCPITDFNKVFGVAVMQYAANSEKQLESAAKKAGVGLWFYERSITLRKRA
jgi:hypothetical protein